MITTFHGRAGVRDLTIYVHKRFDKSFKKMALSDQVLLEAAEQVIRDEFEANLGGGVIKKRISLQEGKRGGARTIIFFRFNHHLFFYDGWAKSRLSDKRAKEIEDDQLESYRRLAKALLKADQEQLNALCKSGFLREVKSNEN